MTWNSKLDEFYRYAATERAYSPKTCVAYQRDLTEFTRDYKETRGNEPQIGEVSVLDIRGYLSRLFKKIALPQLRESYRVSARSSDFCPGADGSRTIQPARSEAQNARAPFLAHSMLTMPLC